MWPEETQQRSINSSGAASVDSGIASFLQIEQPRIVYAQENAAGLHAGIQQGSIYLNGVASVYEGQDQVPEKIRVETSEEHIDVNSAELFTVCMTS